jgi:hypothetical protein
MNFHSEANGCMDGNNVTAIDWAEFKELVSYKQAIVNFSGMGRVYMYENSNLCKA